MLEANYAISGAAASLSLLDNLVKMIRNARREGLPLAMADIVARLPVDAFSIAGQIVNEINTLQQSFQDRHVNTDRTIAELEGDTGWWNSRQYRLVRNFEPTIRALSQRINALVEDFVALAHCSEQERLVSSSFTESLERREHIKQIVDRNHPVGQIFRELSAEAERLRAELGDLLRR